MIIYAATAPNGKTYIGKTVRTLDQRKSQHLCIALSGKSKYVFHIALRKHGVENFSWEILETASNTRQLNVLEKYYISTFNTTKHGYNMTHGGDGVASLEEARIKRSADMIGEKNPMYGKPAKNRGVSASPATRLKMSKASKGKPKSQEFKENLKKVRTGWKLSESTRDKIAKKATARKHSLETRQKLSEFVRNEWKRRKELKIPYGKNSKKEILQ